MANQQIPDSGAKIENVQPDSWREISCKDYPKQVDNGAFTTEFTEEFV